MTTTKSADARPADYTLFELWLVAWHGKWLIALIVGAVASVAVAYALLATQWYQSHAVLMYAERNAASGLQSQLGGLAALANMGGIDTGSSRDEALAVLRSRDFAIQFIAAHELLDDFAGFGGAEEKSAADNYDVRDAVRFFHDNVLRVAEDRNTGRVTLSMFWTDAETAARWVTDAIDMINERMRQRALQEAEANIAFLKGQLAASSLVSLQQSISNLLESELQSLMLAQGNKEYAFRVIDPAQPPKRRSKPRRTLIVASAVVAGGFFALVIVFLVNAFRARAN